jgi:glycosyltransferase involved in cell wall biosynthesis
MTRSISVVIPALNEAEHLPLLLACLERQTLPADAVIVADAGSTDATRVIAAAHGATVVDGGMPGVGRNAGARHATTDLILFLDADVQIDETALASMVDEFDRRGLAVASAFIEPVERDARYVFACEVVAFYMDAMQYVAPRAPGFCLLVERELHERIGGFDESLMLAEDHDYVQRAADLGKFRILRDVHVRTSMRRIAKEGLVKLAFKYLYAELQVMAGQKIVDAPFVYEFGNFSTAPAAAGEALGPVRERFINIANELRSMSAEGRDALRELGETEINAQLLERVLDRLGVDDMRSVRRYVRARARLLRRSSKRMMTAVRSLTAGILEDARSRD